MCGVRARFVGVGVGVGVGEDNVVMRLTKASPRLCVNPTLVLSNLPPTAEEDTLRAVLSSFGTIASLRVIRRDSGLCSGAAEVSFAPSDTDTDTGRRVLAAAKEGTLVYPDDNGETPLTARSLINTSSLLLASQLS